jgi:pSer/pThr/pTyr-binding forkhead associated (FHA) protein
MKLKLLIVQGRPEGKSMVFPRGEYVFGRGEECHVRPNSDWVSRQHCLLRVTADGAYLRDLGSRNGTLINGARLVNESVLRHGDQVQVGPLVFEVILEESGHDTPTVQAKDADTVMRELAGGDTVVRDLDTAEIKAAGEVLAPTREEPLKEPPASAELPVLQRP